MNPEKMKQIIDEARKSSPSAEFSLLVDHFEEFTSLMAEKERLLEEPGFQQRLQFAHQRFWNTFGEVCSGLGVEPQKLGRYFENPSNFSGAQWAKMQEAKQEIFEEKSFLPKRMKKQNKIKV